MQRIQKLLQEITQITLEIEDKHPDLYKFLDENPMTLQNGEGVDYEVLKEYRDGLKKQLEDFGRTHEAS